MSIRRYYLSDVGTTASPRRELFLLNADGSSTALQSVDGAATVQYISPLGREDFFEIYEMGVRVPLYDGWNGVK